MRARLAIAADRRVRVAATAAAASAAADGDASGSPTTRARCASSSTSAAAACSPARSSRATPPVPRRPRAAPAHPPPACARSRRPARPTACGEHRPGQRADRDPARRRAAALQVRRLPGAALARPARDRPLRERPAAPAAEIRRAPDGCLSLRDFDDRAARVTASGRELNLFEHSLVVRLRRASGRVHRERAATAAARRWSTRSATRARAAAPARSRRSRCRPRTARWTASRRCAYASAADVRLRRVPGSGRGARRRALAGFFADDAEWLEYRHKARSPRVTRGRDEIARYLGYVRRDGRRAGDLQRGDRRRARRVHAHRDAAGRPPDRREHDPRPPRRADRAPARGRGLGLIQSTTTRQPPSRIWSPLRTRRWRSTRRPSTQVPLLEPRSAT